MFAFVEGCLFVLFDLGEGAAIPHLVTQEQLPAAIAQNQAKTQGADLVGQPLGGLLFSVSAPLPFLVDAISYLCSLIALVFIRPPFQHHETHQRVHLRAEIAEGLRWVCSHPFLRVAAALTSGLNLIFNALTLVLIVRARDLGASSALIGTMFAFFGAGGLIGSFAAHGSNAPSHHAGSSSRSPGSGSPKPQSSSSCATCSLWASSWAWARWPAPRST
jgi:hypothetical protein